MTSPRIAPYGSWKSPISSDLIVAETVTLSEIQLAGGNIYWTELRPSEKGRLVVVRRSPDDGTTDMTPPPFNARTRVHEYGGAGSLALGESVYFSNFSDQRLYKVSAGGQPAPVTPESKWRYADGVYGAKRGHIICVREDHTDPNREAANRIVTIDVNNGADQKVIASGHDFYSSPRLSPDGASLCYLCWDHPDMPWDDSELWVARLNSDGAVAESQRIAGGKSESIFQPEWSPDGVLYFVSDRTAWWNLYRWKNGAAEQIAKLEAEFGRPAWNFGVSTYAFESAERIICSYTIRGRWHLASLDTRSLEFKPIETPYTTISSLRATRGFAVFLGGSAKEPTSVVRLDLSTGRHEVLRRSSNLAIGEGYLSVPEAIEFPTEGNKTAHAFFYAPKNQDFRSPPGEKPPLIVFSHGGPTSQTPDTLSASIQFWTSRGFAIVDVNYGGSTGYGREYRMRLNGNWGIVDVDDCVNVVKFLAARGSVDAYRAAIRGGSAGGYTTLAALAFRKTFKAGASYYGVSDLEALDKDTHKFESRYSNSLVGPYPARRDLYVARSPIHFAKDISCPIILFQGLEDAVVPPSQSIMMFEALKAKGLPVAYIAYEGEQHGFRQAKNIKHSLESELYFYSKVFGFELADRVEPVKIENMK